MLSKISRQCLRYSCRHRMLTGQSSMIQIRRERKPLLILKLKAKISEDIGKSCRFVSFRRLLTKIWNSRRRYIRTRGMLRRRSLSMIIASRSNSSFLTCRLAASFKVDPSTTSPNNPLTWSRWVCPSIRAAWCAVKFKIELKFKSQVQAVPNENKQRSALASVKICILCICESTPRKTNQRT